MKILTKYYGNMRLEIYSLGYRFKFRLTQGQTGVVLFRSDAYEPNVQVCFYRVDRWLDNKE